MHIRHLRQNVDQSAVMVGIQMLNDYKGHTSRHRHTFKQLQQSPQTIGGGPNTDNRTVLPFHLITACTYCCQGNTNGLCRNQVLFGSPVTSFIA
jgi:hypothetical protein